MAKEKIAPLLLRAVPVLFAAALIFSGCASRHADFSETAPDLPQVHRVVVTAFRTAMGPGESPDLVRDPLSGATFAAEPVPEKAAGYMTELLFGEMEKSARVELVSPGQARGVYSGIVGKDVEYRLRPLEILQEIGRAFHADAVLTGAIYRWREREGTDFAVQSPASVAFDLHLIRTSDGAVIWRAKFDKSQQSLSENLLDLDVFVKGRGRWMSVEQFARFGLEKLLSRFPLARPAEAEREAPGTEGL
jgi:hypothetical protein